MRGVGFGIAALIVALALLATLTASESESELEPARAAPPRDVRFASRPDLKPSVLTVGARKPGTASGLVFLAPKRRSGPSGPTILSWRRPSLPVSRQPLPRRFNATRIRLPTRCSR